MPNNIRDLRTAQGLSMRELADRMGTHFTTVAKIERSQRKLTQDWVIKFAAALGVTPSEIAPGNWDGPSVHTVPVIGLVAAGNWREAVEHAHEHITAPVPQMGAFGLRVEGNSMDKIALPGSIVLVNPNDVELRDGSFYVIMNEEGEATFKQFRTDPLRLEPCSSDPSHKPIALGQEPFRVVGRVTGSYVTL